LNKVVELVLGVFFLSLDKLKVEPL